MSIGRFSRFVPTTTGSPRLEMRKTPMIVDKRIMMEMVKDLLDIAFGRSGLLFLDRIYRILGIF